jgi:WD40 repeat protein
MNNIIEERYTETATLEGHTGEVWCLTLHENELYTGSWDNTIRIWNTETHAEIATLRGHTDL